MHETIAALSTAHVALTNPRALRVGLALLAPTIGAGTVPFANVGNALLAIANTIKLPFAAISYIMAGGGQALHLPQARSLWVGATIGSVLMFGATAAAAYVQANS